MTDLTHLPVKSARLPERYQSARTALDACSKIDECKDWADKAAALASYARQANDKALVNLAMRIQNRANRRASELFEAFQNERARTDLSSGAVTQRRAAAAAGMSKRQEVTARRVGAVPQEVFEELVESDTPPTVSRMAEIGRKILTEPKPPGFKEATRVIGALTRLADLCSEVPINTAMRGMTDNEHKTAAGHARTITTWLSSLIGDS